MKSILKPLLMIAAMALGMTAAATLPARALVELNVNKGNVEPLPIAITDFQGGDALGAEISGIVSADLKRSGLFAPIDKSAFIEKISNPDATPRFEDWKVINAQALVTGRMSQGCRAKQDERSQEGIRSHDLSPVPRRLLRKARWWPRVSRGEVL